MFQISLAAARVNAQLTQEEVARRMKVTKQTIINWEKGRIVPRVPEVEMLSKMYNIPQDFIFLPCYSTNSRRIQNIIKEQNTWLEIMYK